MNTGITLLGSIGLGAGLMYILDPERGRRRRAFVRDKAIHTVNTTKSALQTTSRDARNRARGLVAGAKALISGGEVTDEVLTERVRSKLGRVVSHPHSIEVTVDRGRVTLKGPVLATEVDVLIHCISSMSGVAEVKNNLKAHEEAGNVPGLQGGSPRRGERLEFLQTNWSPAARMIAGAAGGALMLYCVTRRDVLGATAGTIGAGLLARGVSTREWRSLISADGR